jgi:outer membrane biosynthesis protein TonB
MVSITPGRRPVMDRAEATGLGVALAGHAALILAFALGLAVTQQPREDTAMEVSFLEEVGPVSDAPEASEMPAPSVGEVVAPAEEASGATAECPTELAPPAPPIPEPVRPPVETGERRRPDLTRNPVPLRPAPAPRVAQNQPRPQPQQRPAQPQPRPAQPQQRAQPQPQRPQATPGRGQAQRNSGFDANRLAQLIGRGPPEARGTAPSAAAPLSGAQRQAISRQISSLVAPCAARAQAPNGFARSISVELRVTVTQAGVPTGHELVSSSGTNDTNSDYVDDVVAVAMRAVRACAARIATLPEDHYAIAGGWRTFRYRFRFP